MAGINLKRSRDGVVCSDVDRRGHGGWVESDVGMILYACVQRCRDHQQFFIIIIYYASAWSCDCQVMVM